MFYYNIEMDNYSPAVDFVQIIKQGKRTITALNAFY